MPIPPRNLPNREQMLAENPTLLRRFESKIEKPNGELGCWLWTGCIQKGYGYIRVKMGGKWHTIGAHRISHVLAYGEMPNGAELDHLCERSACVNPEHLRPCSHRSNMENKKASNQMRRYLEEHGITDMEIIAGSIPRDMLEED